jgi:hypothetical protein
VLAVAVGLDFLGAQEIDSDANGLEIGAALPPEAVYKAASHMKEPGRNVAAPGVAAGAA